MQNIFWHLELSNAKDFDQGCQNAKSFAYAPSNRAAGMFLPLTHTLASTAPADSDSFVATSKEFAFGTVECKRF
jgi:hypothetical protein